MNRWIFILLMVGVLFAAPAANAQCSICTRSAQQMGEKPARALNTGILYLAFAPLAIGGVIGYKWWRSNSATNR